MFLSSHKSTHFYQPMPYEALILLCHETNWDLSLRAIFHELRLKLSGNTNTCNQVFTVRVLQRWAFNSNFKSTVLKPGWGFYGKNLFFPQKYGHPRDTQSLTAPKHFSGRNAWQRPIKSICDNRSFFPSKVCNLFLPGKHDLEMMLCVEILL